MTNFFLLNLKKIYVFFSPQKLKDFSMYFLKKKKIHFLLRKIEENKLEPVCSAATDAELFSS